VKKYQNKRRVGLLFTVDQKYAWVGLVQGPSLAQGSRSLSVHSGDVFKLHLEAASVPLFVGDDTHGCQI